MTTGKKVVAQFCGGYILEDGTVVIDQQDEESSDTAIENPEPDQITPLKTPFPQIKKKN